MCFKKIFTSEELAVESGYHITTPHALECIRQDIPKVVFSVGPLSYPFFSLLPLLLPNLPPPRLLTPDLTLVLYHLHSGCVHSIQPSKAGVSGLSQADHLFFLSHNLGISRHLCSSVSFILQRWNRTLTLWTFSHCYSTFL